MIISSTDREHNAYASASGAYFSDAFFTCIASSKDLKTCFNLARSAVTLSPNGQSPWMDDNGDHLYTAADGKKYVMSLQNTCMKCHSNKKQFCDQCHNYVAVTPYCWDCHIEPKERAQL